MRMGRRPRGWRVVEGFGAKQREWGGQGGRGGAESRVANGRGFTGSGEFGDVICFESNCFRRTDGFKFSTQRAGWVFIDMYFLGQGDPPHASFLGIPSDFHSCSNETLLPATRNGSHDGHPVDQNKRFPLLFFSSSFLSKLLFSQN